MCLPKAGKVPLQVSLGFDMIVNDVVARILLGKSGHEAGMLACTGCQGNRKRLTDKSPA
jgi:hypothetical protein